MINGSLKREQRMRTGLKQLMDDGDRNVAQHESSINNLETDITTPSETHGFSDALNSAANITLVALGVLCASIFAFLLTQRLATSLYPPVRPTPL
ncbi:hypothetical protein J8273_0248 [Carpediemonas membranifera]|uniref:Uncharacterized protein n=1 Tax=Carpediemonas membranifera TaxID=201153 RepID=A0A8J6E319_9EUKA|nr:hypothetical protein J8273_0248 [Carpediemonas membranifera]|eukprot:KAG9395036.1 hypothetical protein J8273_0248 [Carpediemonas membranifera]